ncbi:MAG TPA: RHS repeat-associated core domain-containing protein [Ktedonobacteraceae bacterium]|nr:RHS repeat-associated core domain-containing protein [Ktedonobacteraceae bacterium]
MLVNERLPGGNKYYYLFDGLGSIVGLTASTGGEPNNYDYDPYGVILNETTNQPNPFQYAGGYFEKNTGLVKFGTRYYNPELGRWTQQDPVGSSVFDLNGSNRYVYAGDDPVNLTDTSGKVEVITEYGIGFFGILIPTGYDIIFSSTDLASLEGPGGDYIKEVLGAALSGAGVPGIVKDLILALVNFEILDLVIFSNIFCGGNGVTIYVSILFSPIPTLRCP